VYISRIRLWNFRRFGSSNFDINSPNLDLVLQKGINVLVGENDSGKSAIVDAIRLVLGTHSFDWNRVVEEDFYKDSSRLRIELTLEDLTVEEGKNFVEWLTWLGDATTARMALQVKYDVRRNVDRVLPAEIRAGTDQDGSPLSADAREYLKCTYLRPLRDAQAELVPKKNSRISRIFQGHAAFKGKEDGHLLLEFSKQFDKHITEYFKAKDADGNDLEDKEGKKLKDSIDGFIRAFCSVETSTSIGLTEGTLKSILERLLLSIKDEQNPGLGTLNRLFMAVELVHLSKPGWNGIRLGLVEELEAHLHPQAQMQVIEELQRRSDIQLLLTTHSPNLASKVKLASVIVCTNGNVFPMGTNFTKLQSDDYKFLECFLDTTKSNLLFAKGVILVEGWAEALLLPAFAAKMKAAGLIPKNLTESGVSVVNVGSTAFLRYSRIFLRNNPPLMSTPVAVITDLDVTEYERKPKIDAQGNEVRVGGKIQYECLPRDADLIRAEKSAAMQAKTAQYTDPPVRAFIAPYWTLEYSLFKSAAFNTHFCAAFKDAHPHMQEAQAERELANKLLNGGLEKVEIAYALAEKLQYDSAPGVSPQITLTYEDASVAYILKAIKYACGNPD
jgi:putative ATP-dependent endonuclease of OLD family